MIWEMAWKLGGGMALFIVMTLWACHKEWMQMIEGAGSIQITLALYLAVHNA